MTGARAQRSTRLRGVLVDVVLPLVVLAGLVVAVRDRWGLVETLRDVPVDELVLVAVLTALGHLVNASEFGLLYRLLGVRIGFVENWMLFSAGQVGNYLPGQVGTIHRFRYLKVVHGLDLASATAAYSLNFAVTVFATGAVGVVGALGLGVADGAVAWWLVAALSFLAVVALVPAVVPLPTGRGGGRLARAWTRFAAGWTRARETPRTAAAVLALEVLRYVLFAWRLQIAFSWLGVEEPLLLFLVIGPIGALATFVAITPAGLGVRELAIATVTVALGRGFDVGLVGSTADRAVSLLVVLVLGLPGAWITLRRVREVR